MIHFIKFINATITIITMKAFKCKIRPEIKIKVNKNKNNKNITDVSLEFF